MPGDVRNFQNFLGFISCHSIAYITSAQSFIMLLFAILLKDLHATF
jgi:hypothetical protein